VKKYLMAAALAVVSVAGPASARIIVVDQSSIQGANLLFNQGTQTGTTVFGTTQQGVRLNFTGVNVDSSTIISANGGQASVEGNLDGSTTSPTDKLNLSSLSFSQETGTFNDLEFNIFGATTDSVATFTLIDNFNKTFTFTTGADGIAALGTGSNFFGFQGVDGESIASATVAVSGGGFADMRQIRLNSVASAVPEPTTWAMMLVGFGAVGFSMRRRNAVVARPQIA
jgi:hypothetical protein